MGLFIPIFFLMCNIGESVTSAFEDMDKLIYRMEWHLCPVELQKHLIVMLSVIRQPIPMRGIFSLDCSRFTFKRVSLKCRNILSLIEISCVDKLTSIRS